MSCRPSSPFSNSRITPRSPQSIRRDLHMLDYMLKIYCYGQNHTTHNHELCKECLAIQFYAMQRLYACPHGDNKPTCARCNIHCYAPNHRLRIRQVMRYSGPRMLWHHPWLTIIHSFASLLSRLGILGRRLNKMRLRNFSPPITKDHHELPLSTRS